MDAKFLFRTPSGAFMRIEHARPVKSALPKAERRLPRDILSMAEAEAAP